MEILKRRLRLMLLVCLMLISVSSYAQEGPYKVGIVVGVDHMLVTDGPSYKAGFVYEWVPKWCGIETGVSWRTKSNSFDFQAESGAFRTTVNSHYINIPFLWRIHFKSINFSIGPELDYYLDYEVNVSKTAPEITINNYSEERVSLGGIFKMGVPIKISEKWLIEPEIRAGFNYFRDYFVGVGLAIKFGK